MTQLALPPDLTKQNPAEETFICDLSTKLFKSSRVFQHQLDDKCTIFSPDRPGLPIIVDDWVGEALDSFTNGGRVGDLISKRLFGDRALDEIFSAIGLLEERGFLRIQPDSEVYNQTREAYLSPPSSFSVWLHIINTCNLGCSYCFVEEMSKKRDLMTDDELEKAVQRIENAATSNNVKEVTIKFAGGEPTLALRSMEYAYDKLYSRLMDSGVNAQFAVLSNGTAITSRVIEFLKRPNVGIGISVDGVEQYHDVHRKYKKSGQGSWSTIVRNVALLKQNGIRPYIMATTTAESAPGLPELAEWVFSEGLATRLNVVRGHEDKDVDSEEKKAGYRKLVDACIAGFEEVFKYIERNHQTVDVARQLHVCELSFDNPLSGPACGIGRNHVVYDHRGFLTDCVMTMHAARTKATDNLLKDVQATVQHMPFDSSSIEGQSECLRCQWFTVCGGGCPTGNERVNGHPYTKSPLCEFFKYVIPRYIVCLSRNVIARESMYHT